MAQSAAGKQGGEKVNIIFLKVFPLFCSLASTHYCISLVSHLLCSTLETILIVERANSLLEVVTAK